MERETFQSRLGFLLLSAGCAIGIGNVWKFPYMVGNNGGGIFVLFYLLFLAIMGVPILSMSYLKFLCDFLSCLEVLELIAVILTICCQVTGSIGIEPTLANFRSLFFLHCSSMRRCCRRM